MSLLLDALRRAEQERNAVQNGLQPPPAVSAPEARVLPWPLIAVCVLLAFACGALLIALLYKPRAAAAPAVVAAVPAPAPVDAAAPPAPAEESEVIPPQAAQTINSLDDLADSNSASNAPAEPSAPLPAEVTAPAQPASAPAGDEVAADDAQAEAPPPKLEVEHLKLAPAPPKQIPELKDMPPDFRANFPRLTLDVHVYDDDPAKRFVMISGHRYREGDALREGPQVEQIAEGGVVLRWSGRQVLLPIPH
ncbi:MAG TPA: general secretion pathway protein GspB [Nevskiaceae bacterium]|nr:general secretion pathway protein GspB [Nevskiaceae bacterium]